MSFNNKVLKIANISGFIGTIVINWLAVSLPLGGYSTGELSDLYPNLFVPAGLTFSIWSVIYTLLLCFVVYQARDLFKKEAIQDETLKAIGPYFLLSCVANMTWILAWHYRVVWLSVLIMFGILASLLSLYLKVGIGKKAENISRTFFYHIPFSIYLGWITVATIANITTLLVSINWNGFGIDESVWTIIMIVAATLITLLMLWTRKDIVYSLVIIWAFIGIIIKRTNPIFSPQEAIVTSLYVCIALLGLALIYTIIQLIINSPKSGIIIANEHK